MQYFERPSSWGAKLQNVAKNKGRDQQLIEIKSLNLIASFLIWGTSLLEILKITKWTEKINISFAISSSHTYNILLWLVDTNFCYHFMMRNFAAKFCFYWCKRGNFAVDLWLIVYIISTKFCIYTSVFLKIWPICVCI